MTSRISDFDIDHLHALLKSSGLFLKTGPFTYRIRSSVRSVAEGLFLLYGQNRFFPEMEFVDFDIRLDSPNSLRRRFRPKLDFYFDHQTPFKPLPISQAFAFLEWGMNWCVSVHMNQYLKLHAAVLEKNGRALVMPAAPGSGKSTLCAALMLRGWRLLSDEHALVSLDDSHLIPVCRPISLKNKSIKVIEQFDREALFGPLCKDTHKGTVTHMRPDARSVELDDTPVKPGWMVFPKYIVEGETRLTERIKETAFLKAGEQSFNYSLLGAKGFETMSKLIEACDCYNFSYSNLDEAVETFEKLSATAI
ncbi:hypothetical protein imdm_1353 [gamma proteobacterium IMCC2047]|nr:hypothetical protein imdm_1353 [gamma proteobacterium IMCC2047]